MPWAPQQIQTIAATNIGSTSVTLNGTCVSNGMSTPAMSSYGFGYSTTSSPYHTWTDGSHTAQALNDANYTTNISGNITSGNSYSITITGLTPGTTYYFTAGFILPVSGNNHCPVMQNNYGSGSSNELSFTTSSFKSFKWGSAVTQSGTYTISAWLLGSGTETVTASIGDTAADPWYPTSDWAQYSYTFDSITVTSTPLDAKITVIPSVQIWHPKLETGNKATSWSMAVAETANNKITIDSSGVLNGIGTTDKKVDNSAITVSAGVLTGIGTSSITVDNASITITNGAITGIGTGTNTVVANSAIASTDLYGTGKIWTTLPASGATVGAQAGVNLVDSHGVSLSDASIITSQYQSAASPNPRIIISGSQIAGYSDATTAQFWLDGSTGKAFWGAGNVSADVNGFHIAHGTLSGCLVPGSSPAPPHCVTWGPMDGTASIASIHGDINGSSGYNSLTIQANNALTAVGGAGVSLAAISNATYSYTTSIDILQNHDNTSAQINLNVGQQTSPTYGSYLGTINLNAASVLVNGLAVGLKSTTYYYNSATTTTFTVPANCSLIYVAACGAGGGGGSGSGGTSGASHHMTGGSGGGGGFLFQGFFRPAALASSFSVTVGAGGTGGVWVNSTNNGVAGNTGGNTTFGSYATAFGGGGGQGGKYSANYNLGCTGGSGAGSLGPGVVGSYSAAVAGGAPTFQYCNYTSYDGTNFTATYAWDCSGSGGGSSLITGDGSMNTFGAVGICTEYGGASGGGVGTSTSVCAGNAGGSSLFGGSGGGAGGGFDNATARAGASGGLSGSNAAGGGGSAGTSDSVNGGNGSANGMGGGGGYPALNAGNGGNGLGGAGGGGGAGAQGTSHVAGNGGTGGDGWITIVVWF
jgi:hypothetical protein